MFYLELLIDLVNQFFIELSWKFVQSLRQTSVLFLSHLNKLVVNFIGRVWGNFDVNAILYTDLVELLQIENWKLCIFLQWFTASVENQWINIILLYRLKLLPSQIQLEIISIYFHESEVSFALDLLIIQCRLDRLNFIIFDRNIFSCQFLKIREVL